MHADREVAVRNWARTSRAVTNAIQRADIQRLKFLADTSSVLIGPSPHLKQRFIDHSSPPRRTMERGWKPAENHPQSAPHTFGRKR